MRRAVVAWAVAYGGLRIWFATGHAPAWKLPGNDLLIPNWIAVAGCAITALAAIVSRPGPRVREGKQELVGSPEHVPRAVDARRGGVWDGWLLWGLAVGWVGAAAFILLDLVAGVLPGLGIPFDLWGMGCRLGAILGAVLLGVTAKAQQPAARPWPGWVARVGAWLAVGGCLTRLAAQAVVGFGTTPYGGNLSLILFEGGFLLVGTLLPFLLVHPIGRRFPRWMLLTPGFVIGVGMTAYFGVGLIQMIVAVAQGKPPYDDVGLPDAFFWVAVPAYVVWGAGLVLATRGYQFATRKAFDSECDLQVTHS
ncbi:hypothetical protein [Kribbella jiaozuonensis]|uniref:Uncharacterized protein n=1 Tax=Kribbella jiaozuonensis TaxID=2575441 RepID=A0A4U3LZ96_9ACTN|nr:hypothetical protein [Kribbella jiaozuonensis]TKK81685.1 hypothetical protein FDA38_02285 [Kribbella jiaozuonensis]